MASDIGENILNLSINTFFQRNEPCSLKTIYNQMKKIEIPPPRARDVCEKCGWTSCKCNSVRSISEISFGFEVNEELLMNENSVPTSSKKNSSPPLKDADHETILFILKNFRQRCPGCFVSHTPLKRWCNKINNRRKNDKIFSETHELTT